MVAIVCVDSATVDGTRAAARKANVGPRLKEGEYKCTGYAECCEYIEGESSVSADDSAIEDPSGESTGDLEGERDLVLAGFDLDVGIVRGGSLDHA